ncbi:MAG: hypothetical protein EXS09_08730 [Gemmataceae bacterium]|nr:hypothetical protein [Gemmataceae bacterium]
MNTSLCESCQQMREVLTGKGSRFLLCELALSEPDFPKYPGQPVLRCPGYLKKEMRKNERPSQES